MKYRAVIETDDFEDFEFFEDGSGKYIMGIDAGSVNNAWIPVYFTECGQESVLDKIRAELIQSIQNGMIKIDNGNEELFRILDKYRAESEDEKE